MNRNRGRDFWLGVVLAAVAGLALLALVVALLPAVLAPRSAFATTAEAVAAQNDVRTTLLQALGGAILVIGAWSAWRQVQLGREGLITERFSRAVDQLGNDKREVRIGGVYALARIARDSPEDRRAVVDVLAAYLRTHSPWPPALPDQPPADTPVAELAPLRVRAPDVLAAMVVLGQIPRQGAWVQVPPLPSLDLRNALLGDARLEGPSHGHLVFEGADLSGAHLERAGLRDARMAHAYLQGVHLEGAVLYGADLAWTVLSGAHLQGADLRGANLHGAKVDGACLDGCAPMPPRSGRRRPTHSLPNARIQAPLRPRRTIRFVAASLRELRSPGLGMAQDCTSAANDSTSRVAVMPPPGRTRPAAPAGARR